MCLPNQPEHIFTIPTGLLRVRAKLKWEREELINFWVNKQSDVKRVTRTREIITKYFQIYIQMNL